MRRQSIRGIHRPNRALAWLLALTLSVSPVRPLGVVAMAQQTQAEPAEIQRLLEALRGERAELPKDRFDVVAALELTDYTPEGVFAWVRDTTRLVPYRGALRGPTGVLMDREGNSLDRALLLQDLFDAIGYDTRLVGATLAPEDATSLLAEVRARPWERAAELPGEAGAATPSATSMANVSDDLVARYGLDAELLTAATNLTVEREASLREELEDRTASQSGTLLALVADVLPTADSAQAAAHEHALLGDLADHWWLQFDDAGTWVDVDPSFVGHELGDKITDPTTTLDASGIAELPPEMQHRVTLALVLECLDGGSLVETPLLTLDPILPAQLLGTRVTINVVPAAQLQGEAGDPEALTAALLEEQHWYPMINVGDTSHTDLEFSPSCEATEFTPPWIGGTVQDVLGGLGGGLFGPGRDAESVTALRLRITLDAPGEASTIIDRDLFDALGSAKRASGELEPSQDDADRLAWRLRLIGERELLVTAGGLDASFVADLTAHALLLSGPQISASQAGQSVAPPASSAAIAPGALHALALWRQRTMPTSLFQGDANVLMRHLWVTSSAGGTLEVRQSLDIVEDRLMSYQAAEASAQSRLRHGVAATNAEALLAAQLCADAATEPFCALTGNAGEMLATSPDPASWKLILGPAEVDMALAGWSADARESLKEDLTEGQAAVVPVAAPEEGEAAWWLVDTRTGAVLGVDEHGRGNVMIDYIMVVNVILYGACMGSAISAAERANRLLVGILVCSTAFVAGAGTIVAAAEGAANATGLLMVISAMLYAIGGFAAN